MCHQIRVPRTFCLPIWMRNKWLNAKYIYQKLALDKATWAFYSNPPPITLLCKDSIAKKRLRVPIHLSLSNASNEPVAGCPTYTQVAVVSDVPTRLTNLAPRTPAAKSIVRIFASKISWPIARSTHSWCESYEKNYGRLLTKSFIKLETVVDLMISRKIG